MAERESERFSRFCDAISYGLVLLRAPEFEMNRKRLSWQFMKGRDVFVSLLTGFRKSIYFQILPFVFNHKSVVLGRCLIIGRVLSGVGGGGGGGGGGERGYIPPPPPPPKEMFPPKPFQSKQIK